MKYINSTHIATASRVLEGENILHFFASEVLLKTVTLHSHLPKCIAHEKKELRFMIVSLIHTLTQYD